MEDEATEGCKKPEACYKAGWLKKDTGRLLSSYKDCYVHVEKTELVVYENEETKTCLERIDLENYDKCRELKAPFKRKQRLMLMKLQKSGNKVHDIKLQAQNAEEKVLWIKALCDAISRAKNKYLDVVTTDESLNLEHVTRTRPKGNRNRRPPTRIHMKEVAIMAEDGTMHLDLDRVNGLSSTETHPDYANIDCSVEATKSPAIPTDEKDATENPPGPCSAEVKTEQDVGVVKKKIKPPMPPIKEARPSATTEKNDPLMNEELETSKSAEIRPSVEATEKNGTQETPKTSPDLNIKMNPPTSPPIAPENGASSPEETLQPRSSNKPPAIPCKEKKPVLTLAKPDQEVHKPTDENKNLTRSPTESESSGAEDDVCEEALEGSVAITATPPVPPKKPLDRITQLSVEPASAVEDPSTGAADTTDICALEKIMVTKDEGNSKRASVDDATPDSFNEFGHFPENGKEAEGNAADGEHLESSLSEDSEAAAMTNSQLSLHVSHDDEDKTQVSGVDSPVGLEESPGARSVPNIPPKPLMKAKSASYGDLLLKSSNQDLSLGPGDPSDDVAKLKLEVSMQVEKTNELLLRLSKLPSMGVEEDGSVNLLAEAVEKLRRADVALTEGKELSLPTNESNRKSW